MVKNPHSSLALSVEYTRWKCSPSLVMMSPYEWKIIEWKKNPEQTIKKKTQDAHGPNSSSEKQFLANKEHKKRSLKN